MGHSKALLPFGSETMLQRVVRLLGPICEPRVVVATPNQRLPELPPGVGIVHDQRPDLGPIEGIRTGLRAVVERVDAAYVCGCDAPFLQIAFIRQLIGRLSGVQVVVPVEGPHYHPLSAVYRTSVLPHVEGLIAAGRLRPALLFDRVPTCRLPVSELRVADRELQTLINVNHRKDYLSALQRAGLGVREDRLLPENVSNFGGNSRER